MTLTALGAADVALFSDLDNRVKIPTLLSSSPDVKYDGTAVRFLGDKLPTAFRGEGESGTYSFTARYARDKQAQLATLVKLFRTAHESPDSRLFLRTHVGQVAGLDFAGAVIVLGFQPVPQFGQYFDLSFTAQAVAYTLVV